MVLNANELLKKVVAIPSVSGREEEAARFLVEQMATFCDEAFVDASGSAVGKLGTGALQVYFLGHIDTVPGDIPVRAEGGKLYGRGSVDAKGSFCTAVTAASRLDATILERLTLTLIGATEEEAPTSRGARHALQAYPKPDFVIIGEPSGWDALTLGYKGRLVAKVSVEKDNFHSAGNDTTAAEDVVSVWNRVQAQAATYNERVKGIFDALQVSLQGISSRSDGLTQHAEASIGYRLPPALTPAEVKGWVLELSNLELSNNAEVQFAGAEHAHRSEKDTPLTRALRVAIREVGGTPRFKVKTGTSDMNVVAPVWDVPMLAYGPGDAALDHTPYEHLDLEDYKKAVAILTTALKHLAGTYGAETYSARTYSPDNS